MNIENDQTREKGEKIQQRWSYNRNYQEINSQKSNLFQSFNLSKIMKKIISSNDLISNNCEENMSILSHGKDNNQNEQPMTPKDEKDLHKLLRICVDLTSDQNNEMNTRIQDAPQLVIDTRTPRLKIKKRFAQYYYKNISTCSSTIQSESFIIHAISDKQEDSVSISLIFFNKKTKQVKGDVKIFSAKDRDTGTYSIISAIKWVNLQTLACGTSLGQVIIINIQKVSAQNQSRQKCYIVQKISLAGISQILCLQRQDIGTNYNHNLQLIQRICFLTKDEQLLIGSILKTKNQQSSELTFVLLYRLMSLNISSLVEGYASFHKEFHFTSHLIQIKGQQTSIIIQGSFLGVIKVWKLPQFTCKRRKCKYQQQIHCMQKCPEKQYIIESKSKEIEKEKGLKSRKEPTSNRKIEERRFKQTDIQNRLCHNTIIMLGDQIFDGFLPVGLMLKNSSFDSSQQYNSNDPLLIRQSKLRQNLVIDCEEQEELYQGELQTILEENLQFNLLQKSNNQVLFRNLTKFSSDSRITEPSFSMCTQSTRKIKNTQIEEQERQQSVNRKITERFGKYYCNLPLKHIINPLIVVSSVITDSSLLSIGLYGSLLVLITADGYLTFVALQIPTNSNEQFRQNYEIMNRIRVFKGEKALSESWHENQNQFEKWIEEFQGMEIRQSLIYLLINRYQFEEVGQNICELEAYVKKLKISEELQVESTDLVYLKKSKLKDLSSEKKEEKIKQHLTAQLSVLEDIKIKKCSFHRHIICKSQCYSVFNHFAVRMGRGFFYQQLRPIDTEQSFVYFNHLLQS